MRIIDCEQGTPDWFRHRQGIPTASQFGRIITPKTGKFSKSAIGYALELIADSITGVPDDVETFTSRAMQHGIDTEPEARNWYQFSQGMDVQEVGFCLTDDGRFGCSPDGLCVDAERGLELKCPLPHTHVKYVYGGGLPDEYKAQVHGSMVVTGYRQWDFMSYVQGVPAFLVHVEWDDYTDALAGALDEFWELLQGVKACPQIAAMLADETELEAVTDAAEIIF